MRCVGRNMFTSPAPQGQRQAAGTARHALPGMACLPAVVLCQHIVCCVPHRDEKAEDRQWLKDAVQWLFHRD
jgi:hypothetical protein